MPVFTQLRCFHKTMTTPLNRIFLMLIFSALQITNAGASDIFADSHIHYNWDHREVTSTQQVIDILKDHEVALYICIYSDTINP